MSSMTRQSFAWIYEGVEHKMREREHKEFEGIQPAVWEQKSPPQSSEEISEAPDRGPNLAALR
jgi:hypothetical protein